LKINVQLFSILRECLPKEAERGRTSIELPEGACLDDLFDHLGVDRCLSGGKRFAKMLGSWQVSVNGEFTEDLSRELHAGDTVIVFPHMAGG
jgi:molybdopterin converting factor small subunit